jgi:hypothetical protein
MDEAFAVLRRGIARLATESEFISAAVIFVM